MKAETNQEDYHLSNISRNIQKLLDANSISEYQLANKLGISVMTIRRVLSGETGDPRISTLSLIANYFGVSLDFLTENHEAPISSQVKTKPFLIPVLTWEILSKLSDRTGIDFSNWENWYPLVPSSSLNLDDNVFALESRNSMQPRIPAGSLLIISSIEQPIDGDLILVKSKKHPDISLRELSIDAPKWILNPIIAGSDVWYFDQKDYDIIGVVILTMLHFRNK